MTEKTILHMPDFPSVVPLLPMRGVILLPRTVLPVPITDASQASMVAACMQKDQKHVGLVQPIAALFEGHVLAPLFSTGCLGEIVEFGKTSEDNLVVMFKGLCRFDVLEELPPSNGCRQARVSYESYPIDVMEKADFPMDRTRLLRSLKFYLSNNDLKANWKALEEASNDQLLNVLSIACPFDVSEKQALLESASPQEQSRVMTALIEMAILEQMPAQTCH